MKRNMRWLIFVGGISSWCSAFSGRRSQSRAYFRMQATAPFDGHLRWACCLSTSVSSHIVIGALRSVYSWGNWSPGGSGGPVSLSCRSPRCRRLWETRTNRVTGSTGSTACCRSSFASAGVLYAQRRGESSRGTASPASPVCRDAPRRRSRATTRDQVRGGPPSGGSPRTSCRRSSRAARRTSPKISPAGRRRR